MSLTDKLRSDLELNVSTLICLAISTVPAAVVYFFADSLLSTKFLNETDPSALAGIVAGLAIVCVLLAVWILILKTPRSPAYTWDQDEGVFRLAGSAHVYCPRCESRPPLQIRDFGWDCKKCGQRYSSVAQS